MNQPRTEPPQYAPQQQPQSPGQPQWEQPQAIPQQLPPTQMASPQPVGVQPPQPQVQQAIRPAEANASSFIPDAKTKEILERTYPEMTNSMINIAIKKFSENTDYVNYFVRDEFKQQAQESIESVQEEPKSAASKDTADVAGFSSW